MHKAKRGRRPSFSWVPAPNGQARPARELFDHCISIQKFYRMVEQMDREQVLATYADEVEALKELAIENGVKVLGPQWFAQLFR